MAPETRTRQSLGPGPGRRARRRPAGKVDVDQVEATRLVLAEREGPGQLGALPPGRSPLSTPGAAPLVAGVELPPAAATVAPRRGRARAGPLPTSWACAAVVARRGGRAVRPSRRNSPHRRRAARVLGEPARLRRTLLSRSRLPGCRVSTAKDADRRSLSLRRTN